MRQKAGQDSGHSWVMEQFRPSFRSRLALYPPRPHIAHMLQTTHLCYCLASLVCFFLFFFILSVLLNPIRDGYVSGNGCRSPEITRDAPRYPTVHPLVILSCIRKVLDSKYSDIKRCYITDFQTFFYIGLLTW